MRVSVVPASGCARVARGGGVVRRHRAGGDLTGGDRGDECGGMVLCYNCGADGEGMVGAVSVVGSGVARRGVGGGESIIRHRTQSNRNSIKGQSNRPLSRTSFLLRSVAVILRIEH